jgi:hypothetical protein
MLNATSSRMKQIERREWWLWVFVVIITLLLTGGIAEPKFSRAPVVRQAKWWNPFCNGWQAQFE